MKNIAKKKPLSAEAIARRADQNEDISAHFTNNGRMVRRVNVDFAATMLRELDARVAEMNVSRQAVIKFLVRQGLDRHYLAAKRHLQMTENPR